MFLDIKEGAFVIADAHYSHLRPEFFNFLQDIKAKKLQPTQLLLLGDVFDALFGGVSKTLEINKKMIKLLNDISCMIEIIYLEGNHDFNLQKIFPKIKVFSIEKQPVKCMFKKSKVLLAHGDIEFNTAYKLYTSIIRNKRVLFFLNIINKFNNIILKNLDKYLDKKDDCFEFINFDKYIKQRLNKKYSCNFFIEGHFHQNKNIDFDDFIYINLASFACNQRYFTVKSSKVLELMEEIYLKGDANGT